MTGGEWTSCQLIEKAFVKKNGQPTDIKEFYLRCSVQDYFIKLCESDITPEQLIPFVDQGISVKMEVKEGEWDVCPGDEVEVQSRIGEYIVISEIKGISKKDEWTHIYGGDIDSLAEEVFELVKSMDDLKATGFQAYFLGLDEYRILSKDTSVNEVIRTGMANITPDEFDRRYMKVYRSLKSSIIDAGISTDKLTFDDFNYKEVSDGGMDGLECILEMNYEDKTYYAQVLFLIRYGAYHLVELSALIAE